MNNISCPLCGWRICDSDKSIKVAKLSKSNKEKADLVVKCSNCKNSISVKVLKGNVNHRVNEPSVNG